MKLYVVLITVFVILLSGCVSKSYVKFVDNSIDKYIKIQDVKTRKVNDDLLEIQIIGENSTDKYMSFRYRIAWEDKDGFEIPSLSSKWTDFPAHKNATFRINVIAPNAKATEYQIYIDKKEN